MKPHIALMIMALSSIIAITIITICLMIYSSIFWGILGLLLIASIRVKFESLPDKCPECGHEFTLDE